MDTVVWALHECERSNHVNIADRGSKGCLLCLIPKAPQTDSQGDSRIAVMLIQGGVEDL
jgi:hypothetical protein